MDRPTDASIPQRHRTPRSCRSVSHTKCMDTWDSRSDTVYNQIYARGILTVVSNCGIIDLC